MVGNSSAPNSSAPSGAALGQDVDRRQSRDHFAPFLPRALPRRLQTRPLPDRIRTVPNAISVARLAGVPVFLWLVLGPHADGWAVALLIAAALSDWLDGAIARAWNQQSRLGQVLDPAADRLYIAATLIGLAIRGIIPWWLVALLVARELVLGAALLVLRGTGTARCR